VNNIHLQKLAKIPCLTKNNKKIFCKKTKFDGLEHLFFVANPKDNQQNEKFVWKC
jgi:hypothetical protein